MTSYKQSYLRGRQPRVHVEYEVETFGATQRVELPFVIGVMGEFVGDVARSLKLAERVFRDIDAENFDDVMRSFDIEIFFKVDNHIAGDGSEIDISLSIKSRDDLEPYNVARQIPQLLQLLDTRNQLNLLLVQIGNNDRLDRSLNMILRDSISCQSIINENVASKSDSNIGNDYEIRGLKTLVEIHRSLPNTPKESLYEIDDAVIYLANLPNEARVGDAQRIISNVITSIDRHLSEQLDAIIHHSKFRNIESTWRGLWYLVGNMPASNELKVRIFDASKEELSRMARQYRDASWDQSPLFRIVSDEEFGSLGGQPYNIIVCDYAFDHSPNDIGLLRVLSQIGAAAHVPMIAQAAPSLFGLDSWQEISRPRDLSKIFDQSEYAAWRALRQRSESRYLAITLPRVLGRVTYGAQGMAVEQFDYQERADNDEDLLWINAAYAMATRVASAHSNFGWYAQIRGQEYGGTVEGLPVLAELDRAGAAKSCGPTEIPITDRRETELAALGFTALLSRKNTDRATFMSAVSLNSPTQYASINDTLRSRLAAQLPYILVASRFAHHLKCMTRDKIGAYQSAAEVQEHLNSWIVQYVNGQPEISSTETRARLPLRAGQIEVRATEVIGEMAAKMVLEPDYQFDSVVAPSVSVTIVLHPSVAT